MIRFPDTQEVSFTLTGDRQCGRPVWRLNVPMDIWLDWPGLDGGDIIATIPKGFLTDGASIPGWARPWLDPWARIGMAAVLHDYLLGLPDVEKWDADLVFLHALRSQAVPAFLATLLYFAVRLKRRPTPDQRPETLSAAEPDAQQRRHP